MKRTRLSPVSKKGSKRKRTWMETKEIQLRNFPMCALEKGKQATQVHHIFGRDTDDLLTNPLNLVSLCESHHTMVEFHEVIKTSFLIYDFMIDAYGQDFIDYAEMQQSKVWRLYVEERGI